MTCEQCTQGYVLPGEPVGTLVDTTYFSPAPTQAATSESEGAKRAIVLLTDLFGLPLKNCKIVADTLAQRVGCDVWVPDLFAGPPPVTVDELEPLLPDRPGEKISLWNYIRFFSLMIRRGYRMYAVRAAVVDIRATEFVTKIRKEKGYTKIGAVGYCFGGSMAIRLGATDVFDSVVVAHPGRPSLGEIQKMKVPAAWVCAEEDIGFKKSLRDQAEAHFASRKGTPSFVEYEFKDYKGTCHGFAARPNLAIPEIVEAYKGALEQTAEWFKKTLV